MAIGEFFKLVNDGDAVLADHDIVVLADHAECN